MKAFVTSRAIALSLLVLGGVFGIITSYSQATDFSPVSQNTGPPVFESQRYFPPGVLSSNEWQDRFKASWYSRALAAMNEPSLSLPQRPQTEAYRFLWLRSFDNPIVVRIWRSESKVYLVTKQLDGDGGHHPGKLIVNKTRSLTNKEWAEFAKHLEQSSYWTLATDIDDVGNDGAQWVLEGAREGRYHIVDRWSPKDSSYRRACSYLLELSGLKPSKMY
jgi:hypothetical protein